MAPEALSQVLRQLPAPTDPKLLVGTSTADDAAVYGLTGDLALVQTVDFFPPVVDDPYDYGQIAVANAISDVYAMGGKPFMGLNIVCFPSETLPHHILVDILRGGHDKAKEAGVVVAGGHTIDDKEPKYGMVVTGLVKPGQQVTNAGAKPGDLLYLTKPLGVGIITTAIKAGVASEQTLAEAVKLMATLNRAASEAMMEVGVHACTDITGFGLLGHLLEMANGSNLQAIIQRSQVPVLQDAWDLADNGVIPAGTLRNLGWINPQVAWDSGLDELNKILLADAQTSGGLLIAVARDKAPALEHALAAHGVETVALVGEMAPASADGTAVHIQG